jgi:hypothetical protein
VPVPMERGVKMKVAIRMDGGGRKVRGKREGVTKGRGLPYS